MEYIEKCPDNTSSSYTDDMDNVDPRAGIIDATLLGDRIAENGGVAIDTLGLFDDHVEGSLLPYDMAGNIRVMRVYWKSRRKIKKVKSYDP